MLFVFSSASLLVTKFHLRDDSSFPPPNVTYLEKLLLLLPPALPSLSAPCGLSPSCIFSPPASFAPSSSCPAAASFAAAAAAAAASACFLAAQLVAKLSQNPLRLVGRGGSSGFAASGLGRQRRSGVRLPNQLINDKWVLWLWTLNVLLLYVCKLVI